MSKIIKLKEPLKVMTEAEFDVEAQIMAEVEKAVQNTINECSKKYYRTITANVYLNVK